MRLLDDDDKRLGLIKSPLAKSGAPCAAYRSLLADDEAVVVLCSSVSVDLVISNVDMPGPLDGDRLMKHT